jgi:activator of HSP90 ATPase
MRSDNVMKSDNASKVAAGDVVDSSTMIASAAKTDGCKDTMYSQQRCSVWERSRSRCTVAPAQERRRESPISRSM